MNLEEFKTTLISLSGHLLSLATFSLWPPSLSGHLLSLATFTRFRARGDRGRPADARRFLTQWGDQAAEFGWTERDLFGLNEPPAKPHPSYSRLSRLDHTGLNWLLRGRPVVALTAVSVTIKSLSGALLAYRMASAAEAPGPR